MTAPDKPRRFARAVRALREQAARWHAEAAEWATTADRRWYTGAELAELAAGSRAAATECEAAADLLEAAEEGT